MKRRTIVVEGPIAFRMLCIVAARRSEAGSAHGPIIIDTLLREPLPIGFDIDHGHGTAELKL